MSASSHSSAFKSTHTTLIACHWLRKLTNYIVKSETKIAPIQYIKFTKERNPIFSFHVVSIIVFYAQPIVPTPFTPNDGPLPKHDDAETIIIELGSGSIRAGFIGNDQPTVNIPSAVAIKPNNEIIIGNTILDLLQNQQALTIKPVIERGQIVDWNYLKAIWEYILSDYKYCNIHFIISSCLIPKKQKEKICQMFFEDFEGQSFALWMAPLMSLYTVGKTTGMVIQCGYGITEIVPIYEGYALPHAMRTLQFGKYDMDLDRSKYDVNMPWKGQSIGKYVVECVMKCDAEIRAKCMGNIVIAGGNSMYDGIVEFLEKEIEAEMKKSMDCSYNIGIVACPERAISSWIGGSIIASIS